MRNVQKIRSLQKMIHSFRPLGNDLRIRQSFPIAEADFSESRLTMHGQPKPSGYSQRCIKGPNQVTGIDDIDLLYRKMISQKSSLRSACVR